jgi:hypothetical protein
MMYYTFKGITWKNYQKMLIPEEPPHKKIQLTIIDCDFLLKETTTILIRWVSNWDSVNETKWWYVIADKHIDLKNINSKLRYEIKRGLNNCIVAKITKEKLLTDNAYNVYSSAYAQYKTFEKPIQKDEFNKNIQELDNNWDIWAVYIKKIMVCYSLNYINDNTAEYKTIKIDPDSKKFYPIYALIYTMNKYYLEEKLFKYVNDGARSISHFTNIQDFLIHKFGFRKAYCSLNIRYRADFKLLINLLFIFRKIIAKFPGRFFFQVNSILKQEEIFRIR